MVTVTLIMESYNWTFDGQLNVFISYYVNAKKISHKTFTHPIDVLPAKILEDAKQYAHTILGYKTTAEAKNLEQYIGQPFTEEV